jgi:hypothetical protein
VKQEEKSLLLSWLSSNGKLAPGDTAVRDREIELIRSNLFVILCILSLNFDQLIMKVYEGTDIGAL